MIFKLKIVVCFCYITYNSKKWLSMI